MTHVEPTALQKAFYVIKKLKQQLNEQKHKKAQPIAMVGLSCRFPQAMNKEAYWQLLCTGKSTVSALPHQRWKLLQGTEEEKQRDHTCPYWGSYLTDITAFDAYFFGISPREAICMDPQQRWLLEVAYEAIEDAGLPITHLSGSNTGIFAALYASQFAKLQTFNHDLDALFLPTGNAVSIAANRLSYLFNFCGPSMVVDTACSSSLVAVQLACLHLQNELCDLALVCGVNINLLPSIYRVLSKANMLSPHGKCHPFDATANGYVAGEGVGAIVLKPLDQAMHDKDRIYAVIESSGINQDGTTNGLTAPNGLQQEALLHAIYAKANIDPQWLSYVECHGTGTFLGDPIEVQALGEVIGKNRTGENPCWIGSVKANIGHLEPAAGIASIIKVALALRQKQIPPQCNFSMPNPYIAFDKYHFQIPGQLEPWPKYGPFRMAGISAFGFGGSNAHVVMRELTEVEQGKTFSILKQDEENLAELFTLSAKNFAALKNLIEQWCVYLAGNLSLDLAALCYNLHLRREHYASRLAVIAYTSAELYNTLCLLRKNLSANEKNIFLTRAIQSSSTHAEATQIANEDLSTLATRYVNHQLIDWQQYESKRSYPYCDMPLYPWQHKHYWPKIVAIDEQIEKNNIQKNVYPLWGKQVISPLSNIQFEFTFSIKELPEIADTFNILHAGYYLEMLAFFVQEKYRNTAFTVEHLAFLSPMMVSGDSELSVQLILTPCTANQFNFSFYSNASAQNDWLEHARGSLRLQKTVTKTIDSIATIKARCELNQVADVFYQRITMMGMPAGTSIRWTQQYWLGEREILCKFHPPILAHQHETFALGIHPGIIDACIQPIFILLPEKFMQPFVASYIERISYHNLATTDLYLWATLNTINANQQKIMGDWCLIDQHGQIVIECKNLGMTQLENKIAIKQIADINSETCLDLMSLPIEQRKPKVIDYLLNQIAAIFSMPKEDINIDQSLQSIGMDSLMALALIRIIETGLGVAYSMQVMLQASSLSEIADNLLSMKQTMSATAEENVNASEPLEQIKNSPVANWIAYRQTKPSAKVRLFCFPYGGGGASIYRDWQAALPDSIEVCPIQLPGREERLDEASIPDINVLVSELIEQLLPEFDRPFAFFGHSFGALIAFTLARSLRKQGLSLPIHLFASAYPDPRIPTHSLDNLLKQLKTIEIALFDLDSQTILQLSEKKLIQLATIFNENGMFEYGRHLIDAEIMRVLLPIFISDMQIVKSYHYVDEAPFDFPITVFSGLQDAWVAYADHLGWAVHSKKHCDIQAFNSGHLFIKKPKCKETIMKVIAKVLVKAVASEKIVC